MAIFRPKSGQLRNPNIEIDINKPCDISNSKMLMVLFDTKLGVIEPLWLPIWPFLDLKVTNMAT